MRVTIPPPGRSPTRHSEKQPPRLESPKARAGYDARVQQSRTEPHQPLLTTDSAKQITAGSVHCTDSLLSTGPDITVAEFDLDAGPTWWQSTNGGASALPWLSSVRRPAVGSDFAPRRSNHYWQQADGQGLGGDHSDLQTGRVHRSVRLGPTQSSSPMSCQSPSVLYRTEAPKIEAPADDTGTSCAKGSIHITGSAAVA